MTRLDLRPGDRVRVSAPASPDVYLCLLCAAAGRATVGLALPPFGTAEVFDGPLPPAPRPEPPPAITTVWGTVPDPADVL